VRDHPLREEGRRRERRPEPPTQAQRLRRHDARGAVRRPGRRRLRRRGPVRRVAGGGARVLRGCRPRRDPGRLGRPPRPRRVPAQHLQPPGQEDGLHGETNDRLAARAGLRRGRRHRARLRPADRRPEREVLRRLHKDRSHARRRGLVLSAPRRRPRARPRDEPARRPRRGRRGPPHGPRQQGRPRRGPGRRDRGARLAPRRDADGRHRQDETGPPRELRGGPGDRAGARGRGPDLLRLYRGPQGGRRRVLREAGGTLHRRV
ncbi:MAG: Enoyl-CoA hydratase, partial [uncultured Rubrobacteraceae bacterium]